MTIPIEKRHYDVYGVYEITSQPFDEDEVPLSDHGTLLSGSYELSLHGSRLTRAL